MEFLQSIVGDDYQVAVFIILNLVLLESLLSVDNAAVLATMVLDLQGKERARALNYGIIGAYVFRVLCLVCVTFLYQISWLKGLGGLYLVWLASGHLKDTLLYRQIGHNIFVVMTIILFLVVDSHYDPLALFVKALLVVYAVSIVWGQIQSSTSKSSEGAEVSKNNNPIYKFIVSRIGNFWSTVILILIMDMAFSLDNVFAAVAFTDKIVLICIGVFIGIIALRFTAELFMKLLEKFPYLEKLAFLVIGILGIKLCISYLCEIGKILPHSACEVLESHAFDLGVSIFTLLIFVLPLVVSVVKNKLQKNHS